MKRKFLVSVLSIQIKFEFTEPITLKKFSWFSFDHNQILTLSQQIFDIAESRPKAIRVFNSTTDHKMRKLAVIRVENFVDNDKIQLFGKV